MNNKWCILNDLTSPFRKINCDVTKHRKSISDYFYASNFHYRLMFHSPWSHDRCVLFIYLDKSVFIVCCNAGALPMHRLLIYRGSTQRTAPEVHFLAVAQCSSRRRDGNTTTAAYRNAAAVDYERTFTLQINVAATYQK